MSGLNKVMIIGHLGRDPETTYTQSGNAVSKISVATTENWTDKNTGEKKEKTEWHRVVFFGKQAETIAKYMAKGSQIYVEGKLQTSQYEKDGVTRYSTDILANNFQFLGGRDKPVDQNYFVQQNQAQPSGAFQQQPPQNQQSFQQPAQQGFQQPQQQPASVVRLEDDDIPF